MIAFIFVKMFETTYSLIAFRFLSLGKCRGGGDVTPYNGLYGDALPEKSA